MEQVLASFGFPFSAAGIQKDPRTVRLYTAIQRVTNWEHKTP